MTIQTKTVEVHTLQTIGESVTCDLCKEVFPRATKAGHVVEWEECYGPKTETAIVFGEGESWPDKYDIVYRYWHICPQCFREKLVPWLKSFGAEPTIEEY